MKKRNLILIALVFALIICATIQPAMAYFTTYVRAKGGHTVTFGDTTKITEEVKDWIKSVTISNLEGSYPVFIRAKVLYEGAFQFDVDGDDWIEDPQGQPTGYYYYCSSDGTLIILNEKESTTPLKVEILDVPPETTTDDNGNKIPNPAFERLTEGEKSFSVVVVYESTPVRYDENNVAVANWDADIIEIGSTSSTTGGNG